jgi:hypothetical protein
MESTNNSIVNPAQSMDQAARKAVALAVISKNQTVTDAANDNSVSRKFVSRLKSKALTGIDQQFKPKVPQQDKVLFHLPVTNEWLHQLMLCLQLHCRASFRGVIKVLDDAFNYSISVATIHNITSDAKQKAKAINSKQDLSRVRLGAHDELYHGNKPILAGVDIQSLYCYLLSQEQQRDSATWAIHLMDLQQQEFNPERVFADDADGLRAGQKLALPDTPCDGDHFHIIQKLIDLRRFFRNRLKSAVTYQLKLEEKMERATTLGQPQHYSRKLGDAIKHQETMQYLSETIDTLVNWMQHDVLNKAGGNPTERYELFDFILDELNKLAVIQPHRIADVCTSLKNQKHLLLAFIYVLDNKFKHIATQFECTTKTIWEICKLQRCKQGGDKYAVRLVPLLLALGESFYAIEDAVINAMNSTERTSSMIENLNSRLRPYLFLRREIGADYLELLRFYLNHIPFMRSRTHRATKSPAELLIGKPHQHWLEMLGFNRFKRAA